MVVSKNSGRKFCILFKILPCYWYNKEKDGEQHMNKILLIEAIRQSNLLSTSKSFLAAVLKNMDATKLSDSEMVTNPYTYSDSEPESVNSKIESSPVNMGLSDEAKKWLMERAGPDVEEEEEEPNELHGSQFNAVDLTPRRNLDHYARHVQLSPEEQERYRRLAGQ